MLLARFNDDLYQTVLFIHLLAFLVTFAPAIMNPLLANHLKRSGDESATRNWAAFTAFYTSRVALSGLVVLLLTGVWMIMISDTGRGEQVWEFSQLWISLAFLVWIALGGVISAMILKGEKAMAAGDLAKEVLVSRGGKIATVLAAVMLYLMVFKPGA